MSLRQLCQSTKKEFIPNTYNKSSPIKTCGMSQGLKFNKVWGILNNQLNKTHFKVVWTWFHMKFFNFKPCNNSSLTGIISKSIIINPIKSYFLLSLNLLNWWEEKRHWNLSFPKVTRMNKSRTYKNKFHRWKFKYKIGRIS